MPDQYAQTIAEAPDTPFDISLRPPAFTEFTGQEKVREQLLVMVEAARQRMSCSSWLEIHHGGGAQAKTIDAWSANYLKTVAHDFAVDMARKSGARSQNDDGAEFDDSRVLTWLFLHCREHEDESLTTAAMSWSMALSLEAGPRPLPPY